MADPEELLLEASEKMDGAIQALKREMAGVRTGRAHPGLLEHLTVEYYGAPTPLNQLGSVNAPEARLLTIQVWDKGAVSSIEKAIRQSELGLNPATEGQLIRLPIPALTEQRRKEMVKLVHAKAEEARVAIRNVRRHTMDAIRKAEKEEGLSKDDTKRNEDELQKLTDHHVAIVDEELKRKEADLLEV
jgi:ribosome recycling factor